MSKPRGFVVVSLGGDDCRVEGQRYCILRVQGPFEHVAGSDLRAAFQAAEAAGEHPHRLPLDVPDAELLAEADRDH